MTRTYQDARGGRKFSQAFECYGTTTPGTGLGLFHAANDPLACDPSGLAGAEGSTLAQNIANVDLLIVDLGTNDQAAGVTIGNPGDAISSGTLFGNMRWVAETYLTANPSMRVVFVTSQYNTISSKATFTQIANAEIAYCKSMGLPVIDMNSLGGVNAISASVLLYPDGVHPTPYDFNYFYGPVVAQGIEQIF